MPPMEAFIYALVALLVLIDPVGTAVVFATMTPHDTAAERARQAKRACLISFVVLAAFGLVGRGLLELLGISLPAMQVAGGILLFLTAAGMVTASGALRASPKERATAAATPDISVYPLAIPLIAGPGGMTTMVILQTEAGGNIWSILAVELALAVVVGLTLAALLMARHIVKIIGETGANVIGRVLGVLLAALAAQIALDGLKLSLAP